MRIDNRTAGDTAASERGAAERPVALRLCQARHRRKVSLGALTGAWLALANLLGGCMMDKGIDLPGRDQVTDPIRDADLRARWNGPVGGTSGATASARAQPMLFPGADQDLAPASAPAQRDAATTATTRLASAVDGDVVTEGGGIELNFDNADIPTVVKSVIGDSLGMNYVVDPRVQGTITLASAQRIPRKDVLPIFESVLRMSNAALLREDNLVRIVPLPEAAGAGVSVVGAGQPGYGVSIVPLRFVSAAAIGKTAESFLSRPGAVRVDQARNVLLIQGTASERQAALGVIGTLDVEWLRNQSVGLYPLKSTAPETMIRELEKVFDTADGGQGQGVIKFQPVSRMNAVLAVSKNSKVLERATQWVRRLDRSDPTGTTVRIYSLRFGNARSIARILNEMFVGRGSQSASDSQTSATAPGQSAATSRIDSLGSGTLSSSNNNNTQGATGATGGSTDASGNANKTQVGFGYRKDDDQDAPGPGGGIGLGSLPRGIFQNVRITADKATNA
ncbi:MAG: secretin N-terminal domain-containing protein, partial [Bradyrhizobium sp.]